MSPLQTTDASLALFHSGNKLVAALRARAYQASSTLTTELKSKTTSGTSQVGGEPQDRVPLIVLAFDEAYTLTDQEAGQEAGWSNFSELIHVLRPLHCLPVFSLFLSTTGRISQFRSAAARHEDVSGQVIHGQLALIPPFTDLGFDTLIKPISLEENWDLEKVTTDSHIAHLGRPLYVL
jgi:hypothetical protein